MNIQIAFQLFIQGYHVPHECLRGAYGTCSPELLCRFAATTRKDDYRVLRWMFDRRVVPQSLPSDLEFCEYSAMTGFIWPETWHVGCVFLSCRALLKCLSKLSRTTSHQSMLHSSHTYKNCWRVSPQSKPDLMQPNVFPERSFPSTCASLDKASPQFFRHPVDLVKRMGFERTYTKQLGVTTMIACCLTSSHVSSNQAKVMLSIL